MAGALVTGGTKGIGLECARTLRRLGIPVAVCGRDEADVESCGAEMELARVCDVTDRAAVDALTAEASSALDGLAVVVANAGVLSERAPLAETSPDVWDQTMRVNVVGVANTKPISTQQAIRIAARMLLVLLYDFTGGGYFLNNFAMALLRFFATLFGSFPEPKVFVASPRQICFLVATS